MLKRIVLSVAALGIATTVAAAADLPARKFAPVAPVVVAPVFSWTGFYAGVSGGYAINRLDKDPNFGEFDMKRNNSFTGGAQVGYNYQIGAFVLGLEGDINYAGVMSRMKRPGEGLAARSGISWYATVRPRLGVVLGERALIYVTSGVAYGQVNAKVDFAPLNFSAKRQDRRSGWTAGAGLEYAVTDNLSLRAEYSYVKLASRQREIGPVLLKDAGYFHVVKAGLNYRF